MKKYFYIFASNIKYMASISLKNVPQELHRAIKILQMDYEDAGEKKTLEDIYIELIQRGLKDLEKAKAEK